MYINDSDKERRIAVGIRSKYNHIKIITYLEYKKNLLHNFETGISNNVFVSCHVLVAI